MATVTVSGPVFDGRADAALRDYAEDAQRAIGARGLSLVHANLDASIRNPTPYYETQILLEDQGPWTVVHDRDIIYGPWLEGVGSRNRTTRFKGYFSFRRAVSTLRGEAEDIAERRLPRYINRMGG